RSLTTATGCRADAGEEAHGQAARAADLPGRPRDGVGVRQLEVREAGHPLLEGDGQLHAGEVGPEAAVDAETDRGVAVDSPVEHDPVGVLEDLRIAVGGREGE